jgi:hypothetical protein
MRYQRAYTRRQRAVTFAGATQPKAIRFMVANMDVIAEMIEKYSATVVG